MILLVIEFVFIIAVLFVKSIRFGHNFHVQYDKFDYSLFIELKRNIRMMVSMDGVGPTFPHITIKEVIERIILI